VQEQLFPAVALQCLSDARLRSALPNIKVLTSDDLGIPTAAKEAIGFAILANETLHLHAGNVPAATGARHPVVLGNVVYGDNYKRLRGMD
jgi:anhydro-N-acetylmuramic acid kinase